MKWHERRMPERSGYIDGTRDTSFRLSLSYTEEVFLYDPDLDRIVPDPDTGLPKVFSSERAAEIFARLELRECIVIRR